MPPRYWCEPPTAFGDPAATVREWQPPGRPHLLDEFRAAVMQHAIAISVRRYKNGAGLTQEALGDLDGRPDARNKWNARLNGRINMTMKDMATLVAILPGAMPTEAKMRTLLRVAEHQETRPRGWRPSQA